MNSPMTLMKTKRVRCCISFCCVKLIRVFLRLSIQRERGGIAVKRNIALGLLSLMVVGVVAACGGSGAKREMDKATMPPQAGSAASNLSGAPVAGVASSPQAPPASPSPGGSPSVPITIDRKLVLNAQLDIKVKDIDAALGAISTAVRAAGGYIQDTRQQGTKPQGRTASLIARVPSGQYGSVMDATKGLGEEINRREFTEDVTDQYVDVESRIKTLEGHVAQLQKLYANTGTIKEMIDLQQEITRATADLESLKGRFRVLSSQVQLSTITINLNEPNAPTPVKLPRNTWERMRVGFQDSYNGVINFTSDVAIFLVTALPVLVYLAFFGAIVFGVMRIVRSRRRPPAA
jgi:hypothetical protein